jgi:subtilisin family serine protease
MKLGEDKKVRIGKRFFVFFTLVLIGLSTLYFYNRLRLKEVTSLSIYTLDSAQQFVNGNALKEAGLTGKNVKIGIIDVGFYRANRVKSLAELFRTGKIVKTKDFVDSAKNDFYSPSTPIDVHGTNVLKYIGGRDSSTQYGLATQASFYLARTDHGTNETRKEQEYFLEALKWFKREDVRLVNVSLGYAFGYDDPSENYSPTDMDGKTTFISSVAQDFITNNNMIIVASAGNYGNFAWRVVTAPADAQGVISVGLTDWSKNKNKISSEGPSSLSYLKPNVSCFNTMDGTSFAAPVITGLIACLMEKKPSITHEEIVTILEKSSHLYQYPNNYVGYGVPNGSRMLQLLEKPDTVLERPKQSILGKSEVLFDCKRYGDDCTVFHKKDNWCVLRGEHIKCINGQLIIKRPKDVPYTRLIMEDKSKFKYHLLESAEIVYSTTVVIEKNVIEIIWN